MKKLKNWTFCLLLGCIGVDIKAGWAEDVDKIYLVDVQRVINECIMGKAARNNIESEVKKAEAKIALLKRDLDKLQAELEKQAALLSGEALEVRREAVLKKERELRRAIQDQREELMRKNDGEIRRVVEAIRGQVQELAKGGNYRLIIERDPRTVIYADSRYDLTDQVIKLLNAKQLS